MNRVATLFVFGYCVVPLPSGAQGRVANGPVISSPLMSAASSWGEQKVELAGTGQIPPGQDVVSTAREALPREGNADASVSRITMSSPDAPVSMERGGMVRENEALNGRMAGDTPAHTLSSSEVATSKWEVLQGASLQDGLKRWADAMGYELVWDAPYDFPIRASLVFDGDFVAAVTKLFDAYREAGRPLQVDIYKEQRLVRVFPQDDVAYE